MVTVDGNEVATLKIVNFPNDPEASEGRFVPIRLERRRTEDVQDVDEPRVKGGHLERSNVNPVNEMVHLMAAYREFEAVQRTLKTLMTDMNSKLIQELGRLT